MTLAEKRKKIQEYCETSVGDSCADCPLCEVIKNEGGFCYSGKANIERNYDILFGNGKDQNPYWQRICKLADKQRAKGMETYGQGLEMNPLTIMERLTYLEEELIDGLMYIEHIKAWLTENKGQL